MAGALSCVLVALCSTGAFAQSADTPPADNSQNQAAQSAEQTAQPQAPGSTAAAGVAAAHTAEPKPTKRQSREAEGAYFAGAKKLERDQLDGAERDFQHALKLDPENRNYAVAISVVRQHKLTELVQQATKARQAGDAHKADTLMAEARTMDPQSPIVLEHADAMAGPQSGSPGAGNPTGLNPASGAALASLSDRAQMPVPVDVAEPWRIEAPALAGAIHISPSKEVKSFSLRGVAADVVRDVAKAYGIRAVVDDSVERKELRFDIENMNYAQAMGALMTMAHAFAVPLDETTILVARDDAANRGRLEPMLQETIYLPGSTTEQINDVANVIRNIFDVKQAIVQTTQGNIVVRAPEAVLTPMNVLLQGLMDPGGEVLVEVKMYEMDTTNSTNVGTTLPTQFTIFNVDAAATSIVNQNQSLVQQAIAQGYISANASNLQIALALIGSGLVQSNLASNIIGVFGGGTLQTGISASSNLTVNLSHSFTDTRTLDDVQMRIGDRQEATFREGTKYPIITSTYSTGISTPASALSNASINGVSVASLLSQFSGGTSTTIPQVTYEDLGITLKATPSIQKTGRINLKLDMKIEALSGNTSDGNPILESRQFASNLGLMDGESAMLVSSVTKSETVAMNGIPGLSELPGFQMPTQDNSEKDTTQLVVVVTPHIVRKRSNQILSPRIALDLARTP